MKEYLKMSDVFNVEVMVDNSTAYTLKSELDKLYRVREVNNHTLMCSGNDVADYAAHAINSHDELVQMNKELLAALEDAATSLETIQLRSFGEDSFLDSKPEMRSYAGSRASVVRAAIAKAKGGAA